MQAAVIASALRPQQAGSFDANIVDVLYEGPASQQERCKAALWQCSTYVFCFGGWPTVAVMTVQGT